MTLGLLEAEPVEVRDRLRAVAALSPGEARERLGPELAEAVARRLPSSPSEKGWSELAGACAGYRRELWLWLAGERSWQQCASGLAGRIARRRVQA